MAEIPTRSSAPQPYTSASRSTHFINRKPAANFWHAFNFAEEIGRPFTLSVTLNFAHTDCPPEAMTPQFMSLLDKKFGPWWRRPSRLQKLAPQGAPAYAWVAENGSGQPGIHWAVHIPERRRADFEARLPGWVKAVAGDITEGVTIHIESIYSAPGLRSYLLKGCDPNYAKFCKLAFHDQGIVHGKRSGVSRSLQRTARTRAGYKINRPFRSRSARPAIVSVSHAA